MIKKIAIKNYRSCLDTTFQLDEHLSVLIGPNSSGKTNILNALLLLHKLSSDDNGSYRRREQESPSGQSTLKVWFEIDGKTIMLNSRVDLLTDENNCDVIIRAEQYWIAKDFTGNKKRISFPFWMQDRIFTKNKYVNETRILTKREQNYLIRKFNYEIPDKVYVPICEIMDELSQIRYYSASQFTNPSSCPVSLEIEKGVIQGFSARRNRHAKFLLDLYTSSKKVGKNNSFKQFLEIVGPEGIGLVDKINFEEISIPSIGYSVRSGGRVTRKSSEKKLIIPQFTIGKNILSPNQLSEGTFKTITLLYYLITEKSRLLLVEEPEVCVHHGLLSSIIELIKTYSLDKQIIVSTHSDFVLDKVEPENVYRVSISPKQGTKVSHIPKSMSRRELAALRKYLESDGNLGEYWRIGGLD